MIDTIVRSFLGKWGSAALDFYLANSAWINLIILFYALALIWSQRTYKQILTQIILDLVKDFGPEVADKKPEALAKILKKRKLSWESLAALNRFPLVAPPRSYWFHTKNEKSLQSLFSPEKLAKAVAEQLQSAKGK